MACLDLSVLDAQFTKLQHILENIEEGELIASRGPISAVRELRKRLGDTQQAFAVRLGLSISAVTNYEKTRPPEAKSLARMACAAQSINARDLERAFLSLLAKELGVAEVTIR